jgi:GNAT superfamily N-acetyltransferase
MANDPTGFFWNRALGLGWSEPITDAVLDQVVTACDEHGAPSICLQVSPLVAGDWREAATRHGFTPATTWIKVVRDVVDPPTVDTELVVRELGPDDGDEYARVFWEGFDLPHPPFIAWTREQPALPKWHCYAAFDGDTMVAVGALYIHDGAGALMGAATLPASRKRGGQGALMSARIRAARELGCRVLFTETSAETPETPNPSLHNMHRVGFRDLYGRQNLYLKLSH